MVDPWNLDDETIPPLVHICASVDTIASSAQQFVFIKTVPASVEPLLRSLLSERKFWFPRAALCERIGWRPYVWPYRSMEKSDKKIRRRHGHFAAEETATPGIVEKTDFQQYCRCG